MTETSVPPVSPCPHLLSHAPARWKRTCGPYLAEWRVGGVFQGPTVAVQQLASILDGFGDSIPFTKEACRRGSKVEDRGPEGFIPGATHTSYTPCQFIPRSSL